MYGRTTVEDFVATEIPYSHGEAYPGLVMLSWNTFQLTTERGFDEMFRAHEVAHQWWGISVRPATYRDWWLAEVSWFFDQWVYGSSIPTYTFSHTFEDEPGGQVKALVRVRQENVSDDFRMIVPIFLDFGDEGSGSCASMCPGR